MARTTAAEMLAAAKLLRNELDSLRAFSAEEQGSWEEQVAAANAAKEAAENAAAAAASAAAEAKAKVKVLEEAATTTAAAVASAAATTATTTTGTSPVASSSSSVGVETARVAVADCGTTVGAPASSLESIATSPMPQEEPVVVDEEEVKKRVTAELRASMYDELKAEADTRFNGLCFAFVHVKRLGMLVVLLWSIR